ncbi:MAG: hypothetical protein QNJ97_03210 [Myxococcota bacterium]|nr:hypothetical protein [Myxococcota bacterium]
MKRIFKIASIAIVVMALPLSADAAGPDAKKADDTFFDVKIDTKVVKDKKTATITATGKNGYHCNMLYPWKVSIKSGTDLPEKKVLRKGDAKTFTEKKVVFELTTGTGEVGIEMKMSFCDNKGCKAEKRSYKF